MKKFLPFLLAMALCTPAFAQKTGSVNQNAPTLEQSITVGGAKMTLNYTSITWASGKRIGEAMDKEKGANARNGINSLAPKKPLAAFSTTAPVKCGELELAAGEYKVYYTITDDCEWQINFQAADKVQTMKLPLLDSPEESKRLLMCLYAGETEGAGVYVAFGKQMCMLDFEPVKADKQG